MLASVGLGKLFVRQGDLTKALPLLERAVYICREAGLPGYFPECAMALGALYTLGGRGADAIPLLTQVLDQTRAADIVATQVRCRLSFGEAQLHAGRLEEAHALTTKTLALAREHQEPGNEADALHLLGELALRREPPACEQAGDFYRQALTLAAELGMRPLQAHCHRGLGTLYSQTGQAEQARTELSTAIEMYREMEMAFWLPETEKALAELKGP
jgi:tetratricopeptide (TPR) repeat protein